MGAKSRMPATAAHFRRMLGNQFFGQFKIKIGNIHCRAYFKKTGKRIFKMSPLHHHFELTGYGEVKTVYIFVIIAVISSAIGYFIGVI